MKSTNTIKLNKAQNAAANDLEGVCVINSLAGTGKSLVLTTRIRNIRANYPEIDITVDASCCAGVTPETHKAALETMKMCQIEVIGE